MIVQQTTKSSPHRATVVLDAAARRLLKAVLNLGWDERHHVAEPKIFSKHLSLRILTMRPGRRLFILGLSVIAALLGLAHPWLQKQFVDLLISSIGAPALPHLLQLIGFAFLGMLFSQFINTAVRAICGREGAYVNTMLSRALYRHTLRLTTKARGGRTTGETVNFYAQDIQAAAVLVEEFLTLVITAFIPFLLAPVFITIFLDIPLFPIIVTMALLLVVKFSMSMRQSGFFTDYKYLAGERLGIVNEWLQNIRIIRILGWTTTFEEHIHETRLAETQNRLKMVTNGSTMNSIAQVAPLLINAIGVAALIKSRADQITPGEIFALLWVFGVFLARPLRMMPWTLVLFLDGHTSCKRLAEYFSEESEPASSLDQKDSVFHSIPHPSSGTLVIRDLSLRMSGRKILDDICLEVASQEFIVITGEVGAGKTQLLLALLRENPATFGAYSYDGESTLDWSLSRVRSLYSYVPQDGFVMSGSLLENIKFSYDPHHEQMQEVSVSLDLAEFNPQHEGLGHGLLSEIGERGVNLSGGQRQRISLARSVWHDRPIVLLDDCLSAVDAHTEERLIERLICGAWQHKTRILVTHRLSILPYADRVFELKNGRLISRRGV